MNVSYIAIARQNRKAALAAINTRTIDLGRVATGAEADASSSQGLVKSGAWLSNRSAA